jgi:HK97 family phage portal protein
VGLFSTIRSRLGSAFGMVAPVGHAWFPVVREPYTGAWQLNDPITTESALCSPSVFAVVSRIASDISKIAPPLLLEQDDHGFWIETTNSAYTPTLRRPNRHQTAQQYHERVVLSLLLHGNAYALKNRDGRGVVDALYLLDPSRVKVLVAPDGAVYYELQSHDLAGLPTETAPVIVPARDLIHMRWNCFFHDLMGISPLYALSGVVTQAQTIQANSTSFFGKGGRPAGVLVAPTKLDPLSAQRIKTDAANWKTGEQLVLESGMQYTPVATTAAQSQLIEQLGWTEEKICEVFGMPISILNSAKQPPYANAEASQLQYKSECLEVHLTTIANGWTEGLELPTYLKIEFDETLLIWMDTKTRTQAARDAIVSGMSPNEVRETYYGLPPVPGGELPYLQQQNWPVSALADRPLPAVGPAAPTDEAVAAAVGDLAEAP